jgi:pSer/pThr/pTyr-binding forkhead associated (FHA) protein
VGVGPATVADRSGPRPILELRLVAEGFDLVVRETGAHDLGRANDAVLRVNHPTVSRKHARIILSDDRSIAYLQDAGGANGTRLNGKALDKLAPLSEGDQVGIGEVELKVSLRRA